MTPDAHKSQQRDKQYEFVYGYIVHPAKSAYHREDIYWRSTVSHIAVGHQKMKEWLGMEMVVYLHLHSSQMELDVRTRHQNCPNHKDAFLYEGGFLQRHLNQASARTPCHKR